MIIFAVAHQEYKLFSFNKIKNYLKKEANLVFDIKSILNEKLFKTSNIKLWRL